MLDRYLGPMLLELNARQGLSIQIANGTGLLPRLRAIDQLDAESMNLDSKVAYACQHLSSLD